MTIRQPDDTQRRSLHPRVGVAILAAALMTAALGAVGTSAPAGASTMGTPITSMPPVTYVDEQGRQVVIVGATTSASNAKRLFAFRDLANGQPDASFGTALDRPGTRELILDPPTTNVVRENLAAVTDDGTLTVTWIPPNCPPATSTCNRWFTRFDVDGNELATPVMVASNRRPLRPLRDGSFITQDPTGLVGWVGPDGIDRGLALASGQFRSAAIDADGRLLVSTAADHVLRKPPAGAQDLDLDLSSGCTADGARITVAAGDGVGFATICAPTPVGLTVDRRDDTGSVSWSVTGTGDDPSGHLENLTVGTIDDLDRVWLGGWGEHVPETPVAGTLQVQPVSEDGFGDVAYVRDSPRFQSYEHNSFGVYDLRPAPGDRVAMAEDFGCCLFSGGGQWPLSKVTGRVLPEAPASPTCTPSRLSLASVDGDQMKVEFTPCTAQVATVAPDEYRVTASLVDGTILDTATLPYGSFGSTLQVTLEGLPAGQVIKVSATAENEVGSGPENVRHTVLPWRDLGQFVAYAYSVNAVPVTDQQFQDTVDGLTSGGNEPADVVALSMESGIVRKHTEPIARLYRAYFLRNPDVGGYRYWIDRRLDGATLSKVSDTFAASSEFKRRYGALSNQAFVAAVYQNVFGRPADPSGLAFWTKRLDTKRNTRGQVVLQFSESTEGIRRSKPIVEPLATAFQLLGRFPTVIERDTWDDFADPHRQVAEVILPSSEFAARVTG